MNYRHLYHAGSATDVFKHWVLCRLLDKLKQKDTPYAVIDTHAGRGWYDLTSEAAGKTQEAEAGIQRMLKHGQYPEEMASYLEILRHANPDSFPRLVHYPGSPWFVRQFLRAQDQLLLSELHPEEYQALKDVMAGDRHVHLYHLPGYQMLKKHMPYKSPRALVLVDPPYEKEEEWEECFHAIAEMYRRYRHGIYAIWYPIKSPGKVMQWMQYWLSIDIASLMTAEMYVDDVTSDTRLKASGMLIINPPWRLDQDIGAVAPFLLTSLGGEKAKLSVRWWRGEGENQTYSREGPESHTRSPF